MTESIGPNQLKELLTGDHPARVIDIRDGDAFALAHIPQALNIPIKRMQFNPGFVPDDRMIVLYSSIGPLGNDPNVTVPPDDLSVRATAEELRARGYQVQVLEGGLNAWIAAGYPVDHGNKTSSLQ